ncbi:MAG TPA: hypothetical protein VHO25_15865 [Polyangiaceae bacterium]|nr:hypothetical protein [Polyangiaceae bacterium]
MSKQNQAEWSAPDYLKRKAKRREKIEPQWFTNPETREKFLIRPRGAMAFVVAGQMQHVLTDDAVNDWQKNGLELPKPDEDDENEEPSEADELAKLIAQGERQARVMARVIHESCVVPKIVLRAKQPGELEVTDLEESDMFFIFRVATGQQGNLPVALKGGERTTVANIKSVSGKSRKRSGTIARG